MSLKMAVVGKDVSKSLSPKMHKFILGKLNEECTYDTVSIDIDKFDIEFPKVLKEYDTLNVTIPYKLDCIKYLKDTKDDGKLFSSVNTIDCRTGYGYNTDGMGFILMLQNAGVEIENKTVLVLGSGGVGRTVIMKMASLGSIVSAFDLNQEGLNSLHNEYPNFTALKEITNKAYDIIINCTGVGMHKTEGISPVKKELIELCNTAVDLIYVPEISEFLRIAKECGKKIVNGEAMLFYQAYYADCIFLNRKMDLKEALDLFLEYRTI